MTDKKTEALFDARSDKAFRSLAGEYPHMLFILRDGKIVYGNRKLTEMLGYAGVLLSRGRLDFLDIIDGESSGLVRLAHEKHRRNRDLPPYECALKARDGSRMAALITTKRLRYGDRDAVLGIATDLTRQKQIERALDEYQREYRTTIDSLASGVAVVDRDLRLVLVNEAFRQVNADLGLPPDVIGRRIMQAFPFLPEKIRQEYAAVFRTGKPLITEEVIRVGGREMHTEMRKVPLFEGGKVGKVITVIRDITDRKRKEAELQVLNRELLKSNRKLKQLAMTDSHTGLYNHRFFGYALETQFARTRRTGRPFSLILADIDYFKSINDVYGHGVGDLVLRQFAARLRELAGKNRCVVRYGGEEFVVLVPGSDRVAAVRLAQRMLDRVGITAFGGSKSGIKLKLSMAVVSYPEDEAARASDLVERVDRVLRKAKEFGGNRVYSSEDLRKIRHVVEISRGTRADIRYLREKIGRLNKQANQSLVEAVFAFAKTIEMKDHYTGEHVERTVSFATKIAETLGLPKDEILLIRQAAMLHDLGKIGIAESILHKPAKLSPAEFKAIMQHPLIGADIIRPIHLLHDIIPLIMYHHERWDGKGYPASLRGRAIPVGARIISLADAYQALISNRPYRKAFSRGQALRIIQEGSGTQFDPGIVEVFLRQFRKGMAPRRKR